MVLLAATLVVAGCAQLMESAYGPNFKALEQLNQTWRAENELILRNEGMREFDGDGDRVFAATRTAAQAIGLDVEQEDAAAGLIVASGTPARIFTDAEWRTIKGADEPGMRSIASRHLGARGEDWFLNRETGVVAVINVRAGARTRVDISYRMDDSRRGGAMFRSIEVAPTALRVGVQKFWAAMGPLPSVAVASPPPSPSPSVAVPTTPPAPAPAQATAAPARPYERRLALVVSNSAYGDGLTLANAASDAWLITRTLRSIGFDVVELIDADQRAMRRAIRAFGERLEAAGAEAVGLFYLASHGLQAVGENFLLPVGADIRREADLVDEGVRAEEVLRQMEPRRAGVNIAILDACRNNPLPRSLRSVGRGLARVDGPRGTLIAYSTAPGAIAEDGLAGSNSPYTKALAHALTIPGLTAEEVFRTVRLRVLTETQDAQVPWESSSLTRAFYFVRQGAAPQASR
jgi:hypothetical protein